MRLLEESGLIAGYVMVLDPTAAGLPGAAFVFVTLDQQGRAALDRFEAEVRRHAEIIECYLLAGSADYLLRIAYRDAARFRAHPYRHPDPIARRLARAIDAGFADRKENDRIAAVRRRVRRFRTCAFAQGER